MLAVNNTIRFLSYFRGKKKLERDNSSLIELLARAEDDEKLQSNLNLMLLSLASDESDNERKEAEVSLKEALYGLVEQIQKAAKRTLDNQTANPSARLQRELDISSLGVLIDRMNKRRLVDQVNSIDFMRLFVKIKVFFIHILKRNGSRTQSS